jgi:hypothetical protein
MATDDPIAQLVEVLERSAAPNRGTGLEATEIVSTLTRVAREQPGEPSGTRDGLASQLVIAELTQLADSLDQTRSIQQVYVQAQAQNTNAILQTATSRTATAGANAGSGDGGIVDAAIGRFFLSPIASAILGLFGGRSEDPPPPLPTYALPSAIRINAGYAASSEGASRSIDYGHDGLPRLTQPTALAAAPQITIQVQALDSRSFLDHSEDIARAVRHAVLNSHALSDVVSEL